jgi:hypothetical protein
VTDAAKGLYLELYKRLHRRDFPKFNKVVAEAKRIMHIEESVILQLSQFTKKGKTLLHQTASIAVEEHDPSYLICLLQLKLPLWTEDSSHNPAPFLITEVKSDT